MQETDQAGTLLVFKPGVSTEEAREALERLRDLLDHEPWITAFNPKWGHPVWYIP